MIKILIFEEADGYNHQAWAEADVIIQVNSTAVDDMEDPEVKHVEIKNPAKVAMRHDMAELIAEQITDLGI